MFSAQQHATLKQIHHYVQNKLEHDKSGHDMAHIERVVKLALTIQQTETNTDPFIVAVSAYVHDIIDDKVTENTAQERAELITLLQTLSFNQTQQQAIFAIIDNMSYRKNLNGKKMLSPEGEIVQDADRLDAIGAIGIGRAFYYGGNKHHLMHDPAIPPRSSLTEQDYRYPNTVINHFYEKLLRLKDQLNTETAKKIADKRHQILVNFVQQFEQEWTDTAY